MIKVLSVIGTKPEIIKMAPVIKEMESRPDIFESKVAVTGNPYGDGKAVLRIVDMLKTKLL